MDSCRRPHPLGRRRLDRARAAASGEHSRRRRRPRPRRRAWSTSATTGPTEYRNASSRATSTATASTTTCSKRNGSGYVAKHGKDFLFANDPWFRGIADPVRPRRRRLRQRLDRHRRVPQLRQGRRPRNGRIYKVTYGDAEAVAGATCRSCATWNWSSCKLTRTTGSSGTPAGCCTSARVAGKLDPRTRAHLSAAAAERRRPDPPPAVRLGPRTDRGPGAGGRSCWRRGQPGAGPGLGGAAVAGALRRRAARQPGRAAKLDRPGPEVRHARRSARPGVRPPPGPAGEAARC